MTIHVISNINGQENEGMRNIATHYSREWEKECTVLYSRLKDIPGLVKKTLSSDVTVVFARAGKALYYLIRVLCLLCKNVWLVCVQEPDRSYKALCERKAPGNHYFALIPEDLSGVKIKNGCKAVFLRVGINKDKFVPVSADEVYKIKQEYGFSPDKKLVVHVGHCSSGRGLEQFTKLSENDFEKLVVVSGMFEDKQTKDMLLKSNVRILSGYLQNVEKIYQMADVYLFPTKSIEYVISIPLSVMEALACGTPVAACSDLPGLKHIHAVDSAVRILSDEADMNSEMHMLSSLKSDKGLLSEPISWSICSAEALTAIRENLK
ncbi:MAG: glycosyltransferase family 4 protein [Ruminococcaceae bacterium]|nr:glycosyltransferase family 4 protein [Oscillospiraceae bacterium]